jgi:molecular chaperone HscB
VPTYLRLPFHHHIRPTVSSCGAPLPTRLPACPKCSHIELSRPGSKYDYYDLLETPKTPNPFVVNESRLKNNFRRVQRYVHPDVWATQGEVRNATNWTSRTSWLKFVFQDKTRLARDLSGLVNEAYNTLLQPLSRIHYILSQHNLGVLETDQLDDPRLIMEVIETREALEDASTESEVEDIKKDVTSLCMTFVLLKGS